MQDNMKIQKNLKTLNTFSTVICWLAKALSEMKYVFNDERIKQSYTQQAFLCSPP